MKRLTLWFLGVAVTSLASASIPEPTSIWEFDGPDTSAATVGAPLALVGTVKDVPGIAAGDGAIQIGEGSYYVCTHGVAPNGGGTKVNEWTLLIDFSYPPSSRSDPPNGYNDLFQTNPTNVDDADWTINSSGGIGIGAVGYTSAHGYTTNGDTWYRLIVVVDNGTRHDIYVDGVEIFKGTQQGVDGRFSLADTILLFCAGNNQDRDDAPINVSTVAFWDVPLTADQIAAVGVAGNAFFVRKNASNPTPGNGQDDVLCTTALAWRAGDTAATHKVFFSDSREDVAAAAPSALAGDGLALDVTTWDVGRLEYGRTYYWRVDEVTAAPGATVIEGPVWSFTVEPFAYPIQSVTATASSSQGGMGPENTVNGSGLNAAGEHSTELAHMWMTTSDSPHWIEFEFDKVCKLDSLLVWNSNQMIESFLGFGAKDVTIEYSVDGQAWVALEGVPEFAKAPGAATYTANTAVDFSGVFARFVKLTINATWGGMAAQTGLSEVRFFSVPVQAFRPVPEVGATDVDIDAPLAWRPGREAASHTVYIGTDSAAVADGLVSGGAVEDAEYTPASLDFATTYYWKVDEAGDTGVYAGDLWTFTTQAFASIDDFEGYNDDDARIYEKWIDGVTTRASGSQVGYSESPFAEKAIVHGGRQAMPLLYDNTGSPYYSEAERTFDSPQDWTAHGATTLRVYFRGVAGETGNSSEGFYLTVKDNSNKSKTVTHPNAAATVASGWQEWRIPLTEFASAGVKMTAVKSIVIGVGNRAAPTAGGVGKVYVDDLGFGASLP